MAHLKTLLKLSLFYGNNPEYILFGGGNTSVKEGKELWVKGSGLFLKGITESGFVGMDHAALETIWQKKYSRDPLEREAENLKDILSARLPGQKSRPSVEVLFHSFLPGRYGVHTHPVLINGLTCGMEGEKAVEKLFEGKALWVPQHEPGYILASSARKKYLSFVKARGMMARIIFMQNHGLFIHGDTEKEIRDLYGLVREKVLKKIKKLPDGVSKKLPAPVMKSLAAETERCFGPGCAVSGAVNGTILQFAADPVLCRGIAVPFTCDQVLYAGAAVCRLETIGDMAKTVSRYKSKFGRDPAAFILAGEGLFGIGKDAASAGYSLALARDAVRIAWSSRYFGGPHPLKKRIIDFILNWEAEKYRAAAGRRSAA
ncbi:MAG: class II aldolase/adducin family protein [Treponema sp.]|jgi:rhamnose utilization protein RhaD (predicted bifunctional aldolase and dehydrogenase)|nr:class II aldolase/adducin family protein [Treponema sp.]